ncbi:MAG TPA: serine O-acetyltransferase [Clostridiales bacterium]|jgi:serine O-acetyltransferase|nr:serine O-acetyltransferase [Clostridiales bacterium]
MGKIKMDLNAALRNDPAAKSKLEVILTYSGFHAVLGYRLAHFVYKKLKLKLLARIISQIVRFFTGIEIHPAAEIDGGLFIDHGAGVVIGETTIIGKNCTLYQGVTLGGTGKDTGKRHPTLEDNVMVSAGAKVLGPITIGTRSKIGSGSVVLKDVPSDSTVVGIPGRVVRRYGKRTDDLDQTFPDPLMKEFARLNSEIEKLNNRIEMLEKGK